MAKLTGAKKKEFLERMAKGRRKRARAEGRPARKKAASPKRKASKKKANPKPKAKAKKNAHKLTGAAKAAFLKRMAKRRKKAAAHNPRASKPKKPSRTRPLGKRAKKTRAWVARNRRNSDGAEAAAAMFETFHQKAPGHIIEYEELVNYPENFAELGKLIELRVYLDDQNQDFSFTRFGDCKAVCTPDGANIYFVGGDQAIDLEALDITSDKDTIELGPCTYICYLTVKGFHDFEPTKYWHRFGEEDGIFPRLGYDRLNKRLFLIGGNYQVKRPGIVN